MTDQLEKRVLIAEFVSDYDYTLQGYLDVKKKEPFVIKVYVDSMTVQGYVEGYVEVHKEDDSEDSILRNARSSTEVIYNKEIIDFRCSVYSVDCLSRSFENGSYCVHIATAGKCLCTIPFKDEETSRDFIDYLEMWLLAQDTND